MNLQEFTIVQKPQNRNALRLFFALLILTFGLVAAYSLAPRYKGVIGLVAVCAIIAVVIVFTRFIGVEYSYGVLLTDEGEPLFLVTSRTGKRLTTLCRVSLADVAKIEKEDAKTRRAHRTSFGRVKYNYLPSLAPAVSHRMTVNSRYEKAEINIEANDDLIATLKLYITEAKRLSAEAEEQEEY